MLHDSLKSGWVILGKEGEDFAIHYDAFRAQFVDEFAIGCPVWANGGIDANLPQTAEVAFVVAAVAMGVYPGFDGRDTGEAQFGLAAPLHPFGAGEDGAALLQVKHPAFYTWHRLVVVGE